MKRKYIITLVIVCILIVIVVIKLTNNKKHLDFKNNPAPAKEVTIPVQVDTVKIQNLNTGIAKTASVAPFIEAKVMSTLNGTIKQLNINLGQNVTQGQVLALIDTRVLELDLQKSQANELKLKNDLGIYKELLAGEAATREKVDELALDYQNAVNETSRIRKQIKDARILAPTSGSISLKSIEQGVYVNAGTEIATIVNLSKTKVELMLTEAEVYQIKLGQRANITTEVFPGSEFSGNVTFISPQADETKSYKVEILLNNAGDKVMRSGTIVNVQFSNLNTKQQLMIPRSAIIESLQNPQVYIVNNGHAKIQKIEIDGEFGNMIAVRKGLNANDIVVTSGQINLKNGTKISISK